MGAEAEVNNRPLPLVLQPAPEGDTRVHYADLLPANEFYWRAFCRLNSSRNIGMAIGPIPMSEIAAYIHLMSDNFDGYRDTSDFIDIIQAADHAYLDVVNAKSKTPRNKRRR